MTKTSRVFWIIVLAIFIPCFGCCTWFGIAGTRGKMPAEADAIAIRQDAVDFMIQQRQQPVTKGILPESITKLSPLRYEFEDSGIFIIFEDSYMSDYGYYYPFEDRPPTAHIVRPFWKVAPGVYRYELHR